MATKSMSSMTSAAPNAQQNTFARTVLRGNAIFSAITGALCLLGAAQVTSWLGLGGATSLFVVRLVGAGVLAFAALVWWLSTRQPIPRTGLLEIAIVDFAWVAASALLLLAGWIPFSTAGMWIVAVVADLVLAFGLLEVMALRRS